MLAVSHDGGGFCSNLGKVLAHLSHYPDVKYVTWNMTSFPIRPHGTFSFDVPEVFGHLYQPYGQKDTSPPRIITSNCFFPVRFSDGTTHSITGSYQDRLYRRDVTWRRELNAVYRKFFRYEPVVSSKIEVHAPQLRKYPHTVAILSRGSLLSPEQPNKRMPTRQEYEKVINEYKQRYDTNSLLFFLCVDNLEDLQYYQELCQPYPIYNTAIRRALSAKNEPHIGTQGSINDAIDTLVELELCAMCEVLVHPVSNMATTILLMNPNMTSRYLHAEVP